MIATNELTSLQCGKRQILEPLVIALSPYAPHVTEELWQNLGHSTPLSQAIFPEVKEEYLQEDSFQYPVSINGKMRVKLDLALSLSKEEIEKTVLQNEVVLKWTEGKTPKKVIIVPNRIVNIVI